MNNKKIGLAVESRIHFLGLDIDKFAEKLCMKPKEFKVYLRGNKDFSLELISRLIDVLSFSIINLLSNFGEEDE